METKIQLSADELSLMQNSEWILTKNRIVEKIIAGFGALSVQMQDALQNGKPMISTAIIQSAPKITRGEKYQGLPYVLLDYPRIFEREHILAIRTLYWWGHFCSITLHIKGRYRLLLLEQIRSSIANFSVKNIYISVSDHEWNHDLNSLHYTLITTANEQDLQRNLDHQTFIKLSAKVTFSQWTEMEKKVIWVFRCLLQADGN